MARLDVSGPTISRQGRQVGRQTGRRPPQALRGLHLRALEPILLKSSSFSFSSSEPSSPSLAALSLGMCARMVCITSPVAMSVMHRVPSAPPLPAARR